MSPSPNAASLNATTTAAAAPAVSAAPVRRRPVLRPVGAALAAAGLLIAFVPSPIAPTNDASATHEPSVFHSRSHQTLTSARNSQPAIDVSVAEATELRTTGLAPTGAEYSLDDFLFRGVINWGGYKFTFYSQQVLPGGGLDIPGRHVNPGGYVSDDEGYIVLAGSAPKGTVYDTPFGYQGKIYDRGTVGNHLDVYIR